MKNVIYLAISIDGYIARKDGGIDWLMNIPTPENTDYGFSEFIDSIDAIVMGKNTFEIVISFKEWPYAKPVFVLSNTMKEIPPALRDKAEIIKGDPEFIVGQLNDKGYRNLYIDGGNTIQSFLKSGLIDEMIISTIPILLGAGIPLFTKFDDEQKFEHLSTESYQNGIVKTHYKKRKI